MPTTAKRRISMRRANGAACLALAAALAGCSTGNDYVQLEVMGPSTEEKPQPELQRAPSQLRPVATVDRLEFGAMHDAVAVTAFGEAPTTGWFSPRLVARGDGKPGPDGFLEFDFVAGPPELNGGTVQPEGSPAQRAIRADRAVARDLAATAIGVRVFAQRNVAAARFSIGGEGETATAGQIPE